MEVKAKDRQSLLDMAVQTAGSVEAAFRLSAANDIGITDTLEDGQVLDTVPVENAETVRPLRCTEDRTRHCIECGGDVRTGTRGHQFYGY